MNLDHYLIEVNSCYWFYGREDSINQVARVTASSANGYMKWINHRHQLRTGVIDKSLNLSAFTDHMVAVITWERCGKERLIFDVWRCDNCISLHRRRSPSPLDMGLGFKDQRKKLWFQEFGKCLIFRIWWFSIIVLPFAKNRFRELFPTLLQEDTLWSKQHEIWNLYFVSMVLCKLFFHYTRMIYSNSFSL